MRETGLSGVPVKLEAAGETHIGGRSHNEDAILIRPDLNVFAVADGAGGQDAGNVASSLATTTIAHYFEQAKPPLEQLPELDDLGLSIGARRLSAAVQEANREIMAIAKSSKRHHGMGSTVVATLFVPAHQQLHVAHVGDSRLYRLRDGRLEQLTVDHSLLNDVMELQPQIDNARVRKLPRNVVTRALGMADGVRVSIRSHEAAHGDRYLLCSDGVSDVIARRQLREALKLDASCEDCAGLLMEMALAAKAADNIAAVVVDITLRGRRRVKSRPRMERFGVTTPRSEPSHSEVTNESVPGVMVYGDSGPDRPDAQPGIQVTTHEVFDDDFEFDEEIVHEVEVDMEAVSSPLILPPEPSFEEPAVISPRERAVISPRERGRHEHGDKSTLRSPSSNPMAPAPSRFQDPLNNSSPPAAGRYTYVGSSEHPRTQERARGKITPPTAPAELRTTKVGPPPLPRRQSPTFSQPRRHKDRPEDSEGRLRTGETVAPPEAELPPHTPVRKSRPPKPMPLQSSGSMFGRGRRTSHRDSPFARVPAPPPLKSLNTRSPSAEIRASRDTPPSTPLAFDRLKARAQPAHTARASEPSGASEPPSKNKSLPPMRTPFETGEFMPDGSVVCHACGSVISSHADKCLYCGAPTGFTQV